MTNDKQPMTDQQHDAATSADAWSEVARNLDKALQAYRHAIPNPSELTDDGDWIAVCEAAGNAKANAAYWNTLANGESVTEARNALVKALGWPR